MSGAVFLIDGQEIRSGDPTFEETLAKAYKQKGRPRCLCQTDISVEMYIAKCNGCHIIKRMPGTGSQHSPDCDSYEPPPEWSGLGEVLGSAIQENDEGITELKFDFSLSRVPGRAVQKEEGKEPDSVRTDGKKLTIKSTLHFLWEVANFHKWAPGMAGKRSWSVIRKFLLQAANTASAKGIPLASRLYLPEAFSLDQKDAIAKRRRNLLTKITASQGRTRQLGILIGEIKEIKPARFGQKLVIKHAGDFTFLLADDIHERLQKRYASEIELWQAFEDTHLMAIATFGMNSAGVSVEIEEIALMPVTSNWIPYENACDKELAEKLTAANRRFVKGLRYNLALSKPLASVVLADTSPLPTAMYICPDEAGDDFETALEYLREESHLPSWVWHTSEFDMPEFPPATQKG